MELAITSDEVRISDENTYGLRVYREVRRNFETGKERIYWKYGLPDGVQVMGLTQDNYVITIEEYQPGPGRYLHFVGETLVQGEDPLEGAKRGMLEETGYEAGSLKLLSTVLENSAKSDRRIHLVLAWDCVRVGEPEPGIRVTLFGRHTFWKTFLEYFRTAREDAHGGGNSLMLATLAFSEMGFLKFML